MVFLITTSQQGKFTPWERVEVVLTTLTSVIRTYYAPVWTTAQQSSCLRSQETHYEMLHPAESTLKAVNSSHFLNLHSKPADSPGWAWTHTPEQLFEPWRVFLSKSDRRSESVDLKSSLLWCHWSWNSDFSQKWIGFKTCSHALLVSPSQADTHLQTWDTSHISASCLSPQCLGL